ncbi:MAG TPA: hypothetical protein VGG45_00720 [Terracidiphilus sp.]
MGYCSTLRNFQVPAAIPAALVNQGRTHRRRIAPEAGRALEILGHAIEYLSDEFAHAGGSLSAHNAQVEAVQLLMAVNRKIYFACPEVPSLGERWRAMLRKAAISH